MIFYDIPSRVVVDAEPATIARLAEIPNVRAVKQAKPDLAAARHVVDCGLDLYAGDDDLVLPLLEIGGVGGVCVHTHVVGPQVKEMIAPHREGDVDGARALDEELRPAIELLRVQTNPIAIKRALDLLGHAPGTVRLPLVEADEAETRRRPRLPGASRVAIARRGLSDGRADALELHGALRRRARAAFSPHRPVSTATPGSGIAGITGVARPRGEWEVAASAHAPELPGDELTFVALADGTLDRRRGHPRGLGGAAGGCRREISDAAVQRCGTTERTGTYGRLRPHGGDGARASRQWRAIALEVSRVGEGVTFSVDGAPSLAPLEVRQVLDGFEGDVAVTAERIDGTTWVAEVWHL